MVDCKTEDGEHYVFGDNEYKTCFAFNGDMKVAVPHPITAYIKQSIEIDEILDVIPGRETNAIICTIK